MTHASPRALVEAQVALESFRLAPDGATVIYALRRVVRGEYESHLWSRPVSGGRPRQLTRGRVRDRSPDISPDGRHLAFMRTVVGDDDAIAQAWILPVDGGEAWPLTALEHGVASARWSPDGRQLAVMAQAGDHRFIVGEERKGRMPVARRITRLDFRDDETGHVVRRVHLWLMPFRRGARPRQLTSGDYDVLHPTWYPDGSRIAFAADRGVDATIYPRLQLWSVGAEAARRPRVRELASLAGDADRPSISPDGRRLAFIGTDVADPPDDTPPRLWVMDLPSGRPRILTGELDRPIGAWAWEDLVMADEDPGPAWLPDGSIAVIVGDRGRNLPYRVTLDGAVEPMVDPDLRLAAAGLAAAGDTVLISAGVGTSAADLWSIEHATLRRVTTEGSRWQRRFPAVDLQELAIAGPGGPIQAWLASPTGAGRRRLPTVLHVHGGPTGAWGPGGTLDALLLCAAGYRVLMPNIRGSATLGATWVRALRRGWGTVDAEDAMAAIDGVVERGLADPGRLAVMGLSYGGFLTHWLVGVTDRFGAASAENGVTNQASAWANSYFGVHFNRRAGLADPLSDRGMRMLWKSSPLRNASRIRTPLLMLQAEEDRICPPADNEQLFTALKVLDREVELVLYPGEHHEMKSSGRPDRRIDRLERILDWFGAHLGRATGARTSG